MTARRKRTSRDVVVDASVARAAGSKGAEFPTSKYCREVLETILHVCHHVVMGEALREEWKRNESQSSRVFLREMYGRGKVIQEHEAVPEAPRIRRTIERLCEEDEAEAILKDFHLLEAAWASDELILSLDEKARRLLVPLVERLPRLGRLTWVNPAQEGAGTIDWLIQGAPEEAGRYLGVGLDVRRPRRRRSRRRRGRGARRRS
ncbi:MAG TPA: hypothetical protein VH877_01770 [Polyangia bacterium]|nr:hypothetical protein [Polyangia bacterium]